MTTNPLSLQSSGAQAPIYCTPNKNCRETTLLVIGIIGCLIGLFLTLAAFNVLSIGLNTIGMQIAGPVIVLAGMSCMGGAATYFLYRKEIRSPTEQKNAIEQTYCTFLPLPPEARLNVLMKLDCLSLVRLSATCKENLCLRDLFKEIAAARFETAALKIWQSSFVPEQFSLVKASATIHCTASTIEQLLHYTDFFLAQIEKFLNEIETIPDKGRVLRRIAHTFQGMHSAVPDKVMPALKRLIAITTALHANQKISDIEKGEIIFGCMKPLCYDLPLALSYVDQLSAWNRDLAYFDIVASYEYTNNLDAFDYIVRVQPRQKERLLCHLLQQKRQQGLKEETQHLISSILAKWDFSRKRPTDLISELAASYIFLGHFEEAFQLVRTKKNKGEIIHIIASQLPLQADTTYAVLSKLLEWTETLIFQESEADDLLKTKFLITLQMSHFYLGPKASEICQISYDLYPHDSGTRLKMIRALIPSDIQEALRKAQEMEDPWCKIEALISIARKFAENKTSHEQAAQIFEAAFKECDHLGPVISKQNDMRLIDHNRVVQLVKIAQHYVKIKPERAKVIFKTALAEFNAKTYPKMGKIYQEITQAYAIVDPVECLEFIQSANVPTDYKAYLLASASWSVKSLPF